MAAAVLVLGAIALTVAVEVAGGAGWPDVAGDATAGAALLVAAGLTVRRANARRVGVILGVAGVAWLAGTLDASLAALHRGPLVHALLAYPDGRLRSRVAITATAAAYVSGAVAELANAEWVTIGVAGMLVVAAVHGHGGARIGRPGLTAEPAVLAGALLLGAAASLRDDAGLEDLALWLYLAAVTVAASAVPARLAWSRGAEAGLPGLVAELGELEGANALRDRLARAIGDPGLVVGYRLGGDGGYVDAGGRPIALPPAPGRTVTEVREGGDIVAVLIHDSATLEDSSLRRAVASTARLAVANTRLQAEVTSRARQVAASRRRLVETADTERRRLESALRSSAGRRLDAVAERLASLADESIAPIAGELDQARADLARLARGLHPVALTEAGLAVALSELVSASPVPVALDVAPARFPATVEVAAYFVCAEAVANAAKHARCRRVNVEIAASSDTLRVRVHDDGRGGASPAGSGLLGLRDRVEAIGGRLSVESRESAGTRVEARLPLR